MKGFLYATLMFAMLLPAPEAKAWWGGYGSQYEADEACSAFAAKYGREVTSLHPWYAGKSRIQDGDVYCKHEPNQYIAIDVNTRKVLKRFRF